MSKHVRFTIVSDYVGGSSDAAYVGEGEDAMEAVAQQVLDTLGTDLDVTIGGTTMFLAAWRDPAHWVDDWIEKLGVDYDDVPDAVAAIVAGAIEGSS